MTMPTGAKRRSAWGVRPHPNEGLRVSMGDVQFVLTMEGVPLTQRHQRICATFYCAQSPLARHFPC